MVLLDHHEVPLSGANAVVVGRSTVVGKPAALLLLNRDATVSVCHRRTTDLAAHTLNADVVVVAAGQPGPLTGNLVGDVDLAAAVTPVPGGSRPLTTALLLQHTVTSALR